MCPKNAKHFFRILEQKEIIKMEINWRKAIIYLLRIALVFITIYLIYKKDFLFAFVALMATLLAFSPEFIGKNYKVTFPFIIEFLIAFALLLHIYGALSGWYKNISFFSSFMHFLGTAVIALLAFIIVYTLNLTKQVKLSEFMIGFFTVIFALAIGAVWEIIEFILDMILGTNLQADYMATPIMDTMNDLIWDGIAGLFVAIIGTTTYIIKERKLIKPFIDIVKKIAKEQNISSKETFK